MIAINLDMLRFLQGDMTDTAFSKKTGISRTQLWRIRQKPSSFGPDFIERIIISYLGINLNEFFISI